MGQANWVRDFDETRHPCYLGSTKRRLGFFGKQFAKENLGFMSKQVWRQVDIVRILRARSPKLESKVFGREIVMSFPFRSSRCSSCHSSRRYLARLVRGRAKRGANTVEDCPLSDKMPAVTNKLSRWCVADFVSMPPGTEIGENNIRSRHSSCHSRGGKNAKDRNKKQPRDASSRDKVRFTQLHKRLERTLIERSLKARMIESFGKI